VLITRFLIKLLAVICLLLAEVLSLPKIATFQGVTDSLQIGLFLQCPLRGQEFIWVRITGEPMYDHLRGKQS
jgi:hypothetical protein